MDLHSFRKGNGEQKKKKKKLVVEDSWVIYLFGFVYPKRKKKNDFKKNN